MMAPSRVAQRWIQVRQRIPAMMLGIGLATCAMAETPSPPSDPASGASILVPPTPPAAEPTETVVHYRAAGTIALMTIQARGKNGSKSLLYSNPNPGLDVEAHVISDGFGRRAALGGYVRSQSITFDESKEGFLPPTELRSNDVAVFSLFSWSSGVTAGPVLGSLGHLVVIPQTGNAIRLVNAQAMFIGGRVGYSKRLTTAWELAGQLEANVSLPTKQEGVAVHAATGVAGTVSGRYWLTEASSLSLGYTLNQERQTTATHALNRGEDILSLAFSSSLIP